MTTYQQIRHEERKRAEREEQVMQSHLIQVAEAYRAQVPCLGRLYHTENGGKRSPLEAAILVGQGQRPGVPDLHLSVSRPVLFPSRIYHSLYIEIKRPGEEPSHDQQDWIEWLRSEGNCVQVCSSFDAAWSVLCWYLDPRQPDMRRIITTARGRNALRMAVDSRGVPQPQIVDESGEVWFTGQTVVEARHIKDFVRGVLG